MESRKKDHIDLALQSRVSQSGLVGQFYYEPMLSGHPGEVDMSVVLAGKRMRYPVWISSMTGGTREAGVINRNLARCAREFGFGMGLGSCRALLESDDHLEDFDLRPILGEELPFFANLGISQVEKLILGGRQELIGKLVKRLRADGLIIHVNPLQEWFQPEGDRFGRPPIDTIRQLLEGVGFPVIVKEVGQGMGPASLAALMALPLAAIEFGAFGGTNFTRLEMLRNQGQTGPLADFAEIGHSAAEMLDFVKAILAENPQRPNFLILSGGIRTILQGFGLLTQCPLPAAIGMAGAFLEPARRDYDTLREFAKQQVEGLKLAQAYLQPR